MFSACVPMKKFQALEATADKYRAMNDDCGESLEESRLEAQAAAETIASLQSEISNLKADTSALGKKSRTLTNSLNEYKALSQNLSVQQQDLIARSSSQQDQLLKELSAKEKELADKEKMLNELSKSLEDREKNVSLLQADLNENTNRMQELEANLAAKDAALAALKSKITEALKNFTSEELTVVEKDGKVYVSLSEQLLFNPGSFEMDEKGVEALKKLAEVLKLQSDVDIIVEGHTDNVPYNGTGQLKDNWDLSVKRATTVTRILIGEGLSTDYLSASGRGDSVPVADNSTKEGKAKNRRTEIILAPRLDKLFQLIEGNQ